MATGTVNNKLRRRGHLVPRASSQSIIDAIEAAPVRRAGTALLSSAS
jgi:hypothetical protein